MPPFDPDTFLAKQPVKTEQPVGQQGFDVDAFLAKPSVDKELPTPSEPLPERTAAQSFGVGTRNVLQGAAALPALVYDAAALPVQAGIGLSRLAGSERPYLPSGASQFSKLLTAAGLPELRAEEKLQGAITEGASGILSGAPLAKVAPYIVNTARPALLRALQSFGEQPVAQAISGATSAGAGEFAAENRAHPAVQLGAAVLGGAAPGLATAAGRRAVTPITNRLRGDEPRLVDLADQYNIPLTPAQTTGSRSLKGIESALEQLPFSSGPQSDLLNVQRRAFNREVLNAAGVNADVATPEVLNTAFQTQGQNFNNLARNTTVDVTPQFFNEIDAVSAQYSRRLPSDIREVFTGYVDDIRNMQRASQAPGVTRAFIPGEQYQTISSDLRAAIRRNQNSNPDLANGLRQIVERLDDAMENSMGPLRRQEYREARNNYRNLLQVDEAMGGGVSTDRTQSNIPFGAFRRSVDAADERGYARGRGEYNDLARIGDFLSQKLPDSGTPERTGWRKALQVAIPVAGATAASLNPITAGVMAAGLALPPLAQSFINSPAGRAWLTNQRFAGPSPVNARENLAKALITQGGVPSAFGEDTRWR